VRLKTWPDAADNRRVDGSAGFFGTAAPVVVGHRGTGRGTPAPGLRENTVPAFVRAVETGAQWVECDAQATADGVLLLRHDVAGGGFVVGEHTSGEAVSRDWDTLAALHAALPREVGVDVEVKVGLPDGTGEDPTTRTVLAFVAAHRDERPWLVTSFDPTVVLATRRAGLAAGWLTHADIPLYEAIAAGLRLDAQVACVHASTVLSAPASQLPVDGALAIAREHGLAVLAWDATAETAPRLAAAGVQAVCVDEVARTAVALASALLPRPRHSLEVVRGRV
jgi:glycerophosphoryl diester phosphodiesterase